MCAPAEMAEEMSGRKPTFCCSKDGLAVVDGILLKERAEKALWHCRWTKFGGWQSGLPHLIIWRDVYKRQEFTVYPRLFLECDLGGQRDHLPAAAAAAGLPGVGPELALAQWTPTDYQAAAELIHACYVGHSDALINDQYRTLHGSLRFLHNIVRFPGCGIFEASF